MVACDAAFASKLAPTIDHAITCGSEPAREEASSLTEQLRLKRPNKNRRIHPRIIQADIPMHMRPGRPTGRTDFADHAAASQLLADLHVNLRHVAEHADEALAMVDKHRVAIEEVVADQDHLARGRGLDRCTGGTAKSRPE